LRAADLHNSWKGREYPPAGCIQKIRKAPLKGTYDSTHIHIRLFGNNNYNALPVPKRQIIDPSQAMAVQETDLKDTAPVLP
jgi:hypothetical protein